MGRERFSDDKMDISAKKNIHGKIMRWNGKAKLKNDKGEGSVYGLFLYSVVAKRSKGNWEDEELTTLGIPPPSLDDTLPTTSEESATGVEVDPDYRYCSGRGDGQIVRTSSSRFWLVGQSPPVASAPQVQDQRHRGRRRALFSGPLASM